MRYAIVISSPYNNDVDAVLGPFDSEEDAKAEWDRLFELSESSVNGYPHPDGLGKVVPMGSYAELLKKVSAFQWAHDEEPKF